MPDLSMLEMLAEDRMVAQAAKRAVTGLLRREALRLHAAGVQKTVICRAAGISRMTLDAWLREEDSR